jgi:alpha-L-fucosidase 2
MEKNSMNPIVKSSPKHVLEFTFPLPRPLTGIALGNGAQGLLIWGEDTLNITIARNGFWDHRGMSKHHKILADIGLEKVLKIKKTSDNASLPPKAYQLGGARLVLHFPDGLVPERAIWCLEAGKIVIILSNKAGRSEELRLWQAPDQEAAFIELPEGLVTETRMELIPAWKWIGSQLEKWGITPPCVESPETAEKLPIVAELLGEDIDGRWAEVAEKLPFSKEIDTQSDLARSGPSIRNITAQTSDRRIGIW